MKYTKGYLSIADQIARLQQRGMRGDPAFIRPKLESASYYRLSGYWYNYRDMPAGASTPLDTFRSGTDFKTIWDNYVFDRRLRLLVADGVERIEIAVRSLLAHHHTKAHGPFGYALDMSSLPNLTPHDHNQLLSKIGNEVARSREKFVDHYQRKYTSEQHLPLWMATEVMTLGNLARMYSGSTPTVRSSVASVFGIAEKTFGSWLLNLNTVRNICAHHSRLWNRVTGTAPFIPPAKKAPQWVFSQPIEAKKIFATLCIEKHCLDHISPGSTWGDRVKTLLSAYSNVPRGWMGFPPNWDQSPLWK